MARQHLIVLGAGGNALDGLDTLQESFDVVAFVDDDATRQGRLIGGIPVSSRDALSRFPDARVVSLIGSEHTHAERERIIGGFSVPPERFATVIHSRAMVSKYASIGHDVILFPGVVIPSNAVIRDHVFILPNTVIHHDAVVESHVIIGAGVVIAGGARIGTGSFVGSGSTIKNQVEIGAYSLVGMSANVLRSCAPRSRLVGNPARPLPERVSTAV